MINIKLHKNEIELIKESIEQAETKPCTIPVVKNWVAVRDELPPEPPLSRVLREGVGHFCNICSSTSSKVGFLGLVGERLCDNKKCPNSKSKKNNR